MGAASDYEDNKPGALHVEKTATYSLEQSSEHVEDLDTIEQTQSGRYAWLVALTAGVGGMLFGKLKHVRSAYKALY